MLLLPRVSEWQFETGVEMLNWSMADETDICKILVTLCFVWGL